MLAEAAETSFQGTTAHLSRLEYRPYLRECCAFLHAVLRHDRTSALACSCMWHVHVLSVYQPAYVDFSSMFQSIRSIQLRG
jgi:hypothetical protein